MQAALEDCNKALQSEPTDAATYDSRGLTYMKMGQFDTAIDDYNSALRFEPTLAKDAPPEVTARSMFGSDEAFALFERRVHELAPAGVEVIVHKVHGGEGVIVPVDAPPMQAAAAALKETYGKDPLFIREGGSIPIAALFYNLLGVPVVMMGFGLPDDNLHAPNEKYSLSQFYKGIRTVARFLQNMRGQS